MSVYMPQDKPVKGKKEKPKKMPKPGSYTSEDLMGSKKIPTKGGYQ